MVTPISEGGTPVSGDGLSWYRKLAGRGSWGKETVASPGQGSGS